MCGILLYKMPHGYTIIETYLAICYLALGLGRRQACMQIIVFL